MTTSDLNKIKQKISPILERYHVKRAALFGSIVKEEARNESDVDILVELEENLSLLDVVGLKLELEEALGKKVDLVEYGALKPRLEDIILREQMPIYG